MAIEDRNPKPGTKLVARYKGQTNTCEVVSTTEGIRYRLEDGREFKSLSSAGRGVTGRVSCDGYTFWSLEGSLAAPKAARTANGKAAKTEGRMVRQIKKLPNQKGVEEGHTKWYCSACQKGFVAEGSELPSVCPENHPAQAEDELAPAS